MGKRRKHRTDRLFTAGFGLVMLAVGLTWLGKSAGLLSAEFNPLKYACPACMALFGVWIIISQMRKKTGESDESQEGRNVQM